MIRSWLRALAVLAVIALLYADAAHRDEAAGQDVLAALEGLHGGWRP